MYTAFIFLLFAIIAEACAVSFMQSAHTSPNVNFLRTKEDSIRELDILRRDQVRTIIRTTQILRTIPTRLHQMRIQYYIREEGYSRRALNSFCDTCLKDMWDYRKTSMTCVSISEKSIREKLFTLFQMMFDIEYGSKEKQCEHQRELARCRDDSCVGSIVYRSREETKQIHEETAKIEKTANELIVNITEDSNACMRGYIQGFEHSNNSCDDNPEQVDDPNRHDSHPHNDSQMEM